MPTPKKQFTTIDEYIKSFPKDVQSVLQRLRQTIRESVPGAEETISYQIPTFKLKGRYLVYFAGWQSHVSVYPVPRGDAAFKKEIAKYQKGKGTLQFPLDKPVPYDLVKKVAVLLKKERAKSTR